MLQRLNKQSKNTPFKKKIPEQTSFVLWAGLCIFIQNLQSLCFRDMELFLLPLKNNKRSEVQKNALGIILYKFSLSLGKQKMRT